MRPVSSEREKLLDTLRRSGIAADAPGRETLGRLQALSELARFELGGRAREQQSPLIERGEIGRGGMAVVSAAQQTALGREVAVKRAADPDDDDAQLCLLREAMLAAQLEHPNIVPIHQLLVDERGPLVVMKRIAGKAWDTLIADPEVPLEKHLDIFIQTMNAVEFAHSREVLHRDIKPENVMIGDFGEVYLLDWGVARRKSEPSSLAIVGTPAYMAPEMAEGRADERTDVFLLGASLHHVLTGRPRHVGESALDVLYAAMYVEPYAYAREVPGELAEICNRACAREPGARFASVAALREAVLSYRDHRAANVLSEGASALLAELRHELTRSDRVGQAELQRSFSETRLAFEAALRIWPESPSAQAGLTSCLTLMIDFELAQRHLEVAEVLLAALPQPDAERSARCDALRVELVREQQRMRKLARDVDPNVGALGRTRAYLAMGCVTALMTVVLYVRRMLLPDAALSNRRLTLIGAFVFLTMLAITGLWRRFGDFNLINRRIAQISLATLAVSFFSRLSGDLTATAPERLLISDAFILGLGGVALAPFHRAGPWLAALSFSVAMVGSLMPAAVDDLFIALSVFVPAALVLFRRERLRSNNSVRA